MPSTKDMYACIEAERARKGWTIQEFSEKIGIYERTYRNWKDGEKPIPSTMLISIADAFECSVDYILGLSDKIKIA